MSVAVFVSIVAAFVIVAVVSLVVAVMVVVAIVFVVSVPRPTRPALQFGPLEGRVVRESAAPRVS